MDRFPTQNNTRFYQAITRLLKGHEESIAGLQKEIDETGWKGRKPKRHQWYCYDYIVNGGNRSLILYHDMGQGKTWTSVLISEALGMNNIVISPIGTQRSFFFEIAVHKKLIDPHEDLGKITPERYRKINAIINKTYTFVPMKSSNMVKIFEQVSKPIDMEFHYETKEIGELDNTCVIIDEAHDFAVSVKNGSKNAYRIFEKIINSKNVRLLLLSGTPIVNTSYEFALLAIMARGPMKVGKTILYAFPDNSEDFFKMYFMDHKFINKRKFQERIAGLISYVGLSAETKTDMPEKKDMIEVRVEMSPKQWKSYTTFRQLEIEQEKVIRKKGSNSGGRFSVKKSAYGGNFRAFTRQICNYALPEYVDRLAKDPFAQIKDEDLSANLAEYAPKAMELIKLLDASKDMVSIVYSDFTHAGGIQSYARALELHGYQNREKGNKPGMNFVIWTSETNELKRKFIQELEWSKENVRGKELRVIFLSRVGSQGLNFRYIRQVILIEPFWNMTRILQTIARGTRIGSHKDLPEKERNVTPYILLSTMPIKEFEGETMSTDEFIYNSAMTESVENAPVLEAIRETSIHCQLTDDSDCFQCSASSKDAPIFDPNPVIHFKSDSVCLA